MADRRDNAVATAQSYHQGNIADLDDAMSRRLIASTVVTESRGGDLTITNNQGYTGRYQAGAGWLADAGYVDKARGLTCIGAVAISEEGVRTFALRDTSSKDIVDTATVQAVHTSIT